MVSVEAMTSGGSVRKGVYRVDLQCFGDFFKSFNAKDGFSEFGPVFANFFNDTDFGDRCKDLWRHFRFPAYFTGELSLWEDLTRIYSAGPHFYFSQKGNRQTMHMD